MRSEALRFVLIHVLLYATIFLDSKLIKINSSISNLKFNKWTLRVFGKDRNCETTAILWQLISGIYSNRTYFQEIILLGPANQRINKMNVPEEYKALQKKIGLDPSEGFGNIVERVFHFIALFTCDSMFAMFFVSKIHDNLHGALIAVPALSAFTVMMTTYCYLLIDRRRFNSLSEELQQIVRVKN